MTRIMLLCSAGMSTSMLARKMETAARESGADCKIWAASEAESKRYYDDVDVILLGPQVRFMKARIEKALGARPVRIDVIDPTSYGRMDGGPVLERALRLADA